MKRYLATALLVVLGAAAQAQQSEESASTAWSEINLAVTDAHVLPAYAAFAEASAALLPAAERFCESPGAATLATLREAYHGTMDAWQGVQHIQFGPVTFFNWNFRLQYWPDEKNTGGRQLDALIAAADEGVLEADRFARQSVGVQGFPALERLLFDEQALRQLSEDAYRCRVLTAIAANIADAASGIGQRWRDEFRATVAGTDDSGYFEDAQDATVEFYKALEETLRKNQQQKVEAVIGDSPEGARERRAESWRSARSLRNLKLNIAAFRELYDGSEPALASALQPEDRASVAEAFDALQGSAGQLPDSYAEALAGEEGYRQLRELRQGMDDLYEAVEAALKNTDLYLGFNSLDGD